MSNIAALPGYVAPLSQGEPDQDLVDMLKTLLAEAESGHLRAMGYAVYRSTGRVSSGFKAGRYNLELGAAIMLLHHDYGAALSGE